MSQSDAPVVSIISCPVHDSVEAVKPLVKQACDLVGGLESLIMPGDTVLLKPNQVVARPYTTGATTNPFIVEAVVELCREAHAKRIIIGDGACVGTSTLDVFRATGYDKMAERLGCELVDFTTCDYQYVLNPLAKKMRRIRLPLPFLEANVVINLPVMKTHDVLEVSLGLKNMKGLLRTDDKKRFHKWGLEQAVAELGYLTLPDLTIIDGTIGMEGSGPAVGDPVGLGLLLASKDTIAGDTVALTVMGYTLDEVGYLKLAGENGLGCTNLDDIELQGERLENVIRPFRRTSIDPQELAEYGIELVACDACSGCANAVQNYLVALAKRGALDDMRDTILLYGQSVEELPAERTAGKRVIRIGSCTRKLVGYEHYFPGCPPFLYSMLEEMGL